MLYNFYVFNRKGKCLYYREWDRPLNTMADDPVEERKLVFGMLFSLKDLATKLSPNQDNDSLRTVKTNAFNLHHYESPSGLMFVLNTHSDLADLSSNLQFVYAQIYVDCIARNPLYRYQSNEPFTSSLFTSRLEDYLFSVVNTK